MLCLYRLIMKRQRISPEKNFIWVAPDERGEYYATIHYSNKLNIDVVGKVDMSHWDEEQKRLDAMVSNNFVGYEFGEWCSIELQQPYEEKGKWQIDA